jgi:phosphonate C-P lyase system protein PhnG
MDDKSLSRLLRLLPLDKIAVSKAPETGLIMATAQDCFNTNFCLGEILVTVAETKIGNAKGYSMILGDDPHKAVISASLDAILKSDDAKLKSKILRNLRAFERRLMSRQRSETLLPSSTRVHFETMPEG